MGDIHTAIAAISAARNPPQRMYRRRAHWPRGLPNADEHTLKARVMIIIGKGIEQLGLTQQAAAKRMGIKQPDASNLHPEQFDH
jgi:hypothetical protein